MIATSNLAIDNHATIKNERSIMLGIKGYPSSEGDRDRASFRPLTKGDC